MKKLKLNSRSKSSGQVIVLFIIVLGLIGVGFWWLLSNKQEMTKEGKEFAREAIQRIAVQHDQNFFASHLSPQARMNYPPSAQQEFFLDIAKLGTPVGPVDVQGDMEFQSQFFEPHGPMLTSLFHIRLGAGSLMKLHLFRRRNASARWLSRFVIETRTRYPNKRSRESRQICDQVSIVSRRERNSSLGRNVSPVIMASRFCTFGLASLKT